MITSYVTQTINRDAGDHDIHWNSDSWSAIVFGKYSNFHLFQTRAYFYQICRFLITFYQLHWHHSDHSAPFGRVTQAEKSSTALSCFGRCTCSKMLDAGYTIWTYFLRFGLKSTPFIWNSNGEVKMYSWNHIEILSPGNNWFQICWSHFYFFFVYRVECETKECVSREIAAKVRVKVYYSHHVYFQ